MRAGDAKARRPRGHLRSVHQPQPAATLPLRPRPRLAQLAERAPQLRKNKEKPIIVYCGRGNQSQQAAAILRKHGYANVFNLSGGFAAWQQAGLPIEK